MPERGLRIGEVVKLTGLHEQTIRKLQRRGVINSARDATGKHSYRVFPASVVPFLRELYKRNVDVGPSALQMLMGATAGDSIAMATGVVDSIVALRPSDAAQPETDGYLCWPGVV